MSEEIEHTHDVGIYPSPIAHAVPEPMPIRDFAPWHLPRKQWVRREQWGYCTKRLMSSLVLTDRPLRYLGLPGSELLDLELLAAMCEQEQVSLRFLGFNTGSQTTGQQTTQRLSEDLVRSIKGVDSSSTVTNDDILSLASKKSLAWQRLKDIESFDVVNLDLCDVFTSKQGKPVHGAVRNLVEFQVNRRTQPWVLFVTTAIDKEAVADADLVQYRKKFDENAEQWEEFNALAAALAGVANDSPEIGNAGAIFDKADGKLFGQLLSVSIGKWLASLLNQPVPWGVELKSCVCYRRAMTTLGAAKMAVPEPELFSLVFRIDRDVQTVQDPSGLAPAPKPAPAPASWADAERAMARQMVQKIQRVLDLDVHLQGKPDEYKKLADETASLLALRNFDSERYMAFANSVITVPVAETPLA